MDTIIKSMDFSRSGFAKLVLILLGSVVVSGVLVGCGIDLTPRAGAQSPTPVPVVTQEPGVRAEGRLLPADHSWLVFSRPGMVAEIQVEEGEQVEQSQVLARLGEREQLEAAVAAAQLELVDAQQSVERLERQTGLAASSAESNLREAEKALIDAQLALDEMDTEEYQDQLDEAWIEVIDARNELRDARDELEDYIHMAEDNENRVNAQNAFDEAERNYTDRLREYELLRNDLNQVRVRAALAEARLEDARYEYELYSEGPNREALALAQARLDNAETQVSAAQAALDDLEIRAPFDGRVVEIRISEGKWSGAGVQAVLLADYSEWYVETTDLTEMDVVRIENGSRVVVIPDALPDVQLVGEIVKIADSFVELRGDILYTVRIRLDETDERLRWGMTATVRFQQ
jgi:multidrug efflux pump subunit AcrA (membrane-fusion protein)